MQRLLDAVRRRGRFRVWTTQRVATDDLPLLVNACSQKCVEAIPDAPDGFVRRPHRGGREIQPPGR